ncbi:hypothetical protein M514_02665 [Trichuris suis]|uniref:Uncharacterized protein n=2 Tax=Trichuris suis TaxID=68888 RepID=A0A085NNP3_9BILA|nr:hypothetical protein M514_02665 [Trichuris suis]
MATKLRRGSATKSISIQTIAMSVSGSYFTSLATLSGISSSAMPYRDDTSSSAMLYHRQLRRISNRCAEMHSFPLVDSYCTA